MGKENNTSNSHEDFESDGMNKIEETENNTSEEEVIRMKQISSFCLQFKNWTMSDTPESILRRFVNMNDTAEIEERKTNGNKSSIVASMMKLLSNRLTSIQKFLYLVNCT